MAKNFTSELEHHNLNIRYINIICIALILYIVLLFCDKRDSRYKIILHTKVQRLFTSPDIHTHTNYSDVSTFSTNAAVL